MRRKILQALAPLLAIATLMVGLRVGAKDAVVAATVFAAPVAKSAPGQPPVLAWQIVTFLEDRGVRETVPVPGLTVVARSNGKEARWTGATNLDGVAEASLPIEGLREGDPVDLDVRATGYAAPLASGHAAWKSVDWARARGAGEGALPAVRPSKRGGALAVDVLVESGRLVPGFPSTLWVRVSPPPAEPARVAITPEPGLVAAAAETTTCDGGWASVDVTAQAHVTGALFRATAPSGATGEWFGALPVAPGAFFVSAPRVVDEGEAEQAVLIAPNPRTVVYAEVDDEQGRVAAAALPVVVEPPDPTPRARFDVPPLAAGLHWLVVSGEPRGAERLLGAAIAKPFFVGAKGAANDACAIGPTLARSPAEGFPRWVALDGFPGRSAHNRARHRAGLAIAGIALAAAALLEVLLLIGAAREAKAAIRIAELGEGATDDDAKRITAKSPGGGIAVALLLAVLGFALLGALLIAKA